MAFLQACYGQYRIRMSNRLVPKVAVVLRQNRRIIERKYNEKTRLLRKQGNEAPCLKLMECVHELPQSISLCLASPDVDREVLRDVIRGVVKAALAQPKSE